MINWKVRFKNKVWLTTFVTFIISTVYQVLLMFDITPVITQDTIVRIAGGILQLLSLIGIIIDPTTKGVEDSTRALEYEEPN